MASRRFSVTQTECPNSRSRKWTATLFICIALTAITWFVFGQTLSFGFINYDDPEWVSENPYITRGITTQGVAWALTAVQAGPLASISHMLDCDTYGLNPAGHHFTNVLLHTLTALLLFLILRQMTGAMWRSGVVAALFAIHPLRVESVAWVTERKDVLSGVFFVITLGAYVWYVHRPSIGRYLAVASFFVLGLSSKGMLMTLPLVLLLLDYWPLNRSQRSASGLSELSPYEQKPEGPTLRPVSLTGWKRPRRGSIASTYDSLLNSNGKRDTRTSDEAYHLPTSGIRRGVKRL
jgi:hypothetical protein